MLQPSLATTHRVVGRYSIHAEIGSGGMATVHVGRLLGEAGFSKTVAIKRLHEQLAKDPDFVAMLLDEARLASRIRHTNVVSMLDVVREGNDVFLVMDYVAGESLARLQRLSRAEQSQGIPPEVALGVMVGVLHGLHAAHEARSENGKLLGVVHRDVSPQNILVDVDGVARVIDFGVAKAVQRQHSTVSGTIKGKVGYMAPEQVEGRAVDRRADIFSACVVLWELLAHRRLFQAESDVALLRQIVVRALRGEIPPPSQHNPAVPAVLDEIVVRGLSYDPDQRWSTARELAVAIEESARIASARQVADWVDRVAGPIVRARAEVVADIESAFSTVISQRNPMRPIAEPIGDAEREVSTVLAVPQARNDLSPTPFSRARAHSNSRTWVIAIASLAVFVGAVAAAVLVVFLRAQRADSTAGAALATPLPPAKITPASAPTTADTARGLESAVLDASTVPSDDAADGAAASARFANRSDRKVTKQRDPAIASPKPATSVRAKGPAPTSTPPPSPACNPPFVIDANGTKVYKPECLQ